MLTVAAHLGRASAPAPPDAGDGTGSPPQGILVVAETYRWTHAFTLQCCIEALGPLYVLGDTMPEARAAGDRVRSFAYALGRNAL